MTRRPHANLELIKRVLGNDFLELAIHRLTLAEKLDSEVCSVVVEATQSGNGQAPVMEGEGCGIADAIYTALLSRYGTEYQSLQSISFTSFRVNARLGSESSHAGLDAVAEVELVVQNSEGSLFTFTDASRSITSSTARAVIAAIEYFLNAERAFITLYRSLKDAQARNREDLVTRYTRELAEVVKSTSYAEVIENIKKDLP
ncbi:MAG TPA: alpha-isopropylmalate synthase regulatory domain-containing protein [Kofleriaceae bacterium]|nr:alpha-isopropylmalate synthase regulatory domain-containing protein [Kofleriaceae bacterium]